MDGGVFALTPGDGLHFSFDTEVIPMRMNEGRNAGVRSCTIDWSRDQHFAAGWVEARVPAHFKVRKSETRLERIAIHREADQSLEHGQRPRHRDPPLLVRRRAWDAVHSREIAPGAKAILTPKGEEVPPRPAETLRHVSRRSWLGNFQTLA